MGGSTWRAGLLHKHHAGLACARHEAGDRCRPRSHRQGFPAMKHTPVPTSETVRIPFLETARAYFKLSQTQRRLAHASRREALQWEQAGNYQNFASCMLEGRRLWKDAWW